MARPYTGKHSFRIIEREKNGTIYVFEQESWYDQSTKNTKYKHVLKGIRDPQTGEIKPTRPKSKKKAPSDVPVTVEITFNAMLEIIKIVSEISGVGAEVLAALPNDRGIAEKILTLAWYIFSNDGCTWPGVENWSNRYLKLLPYSYNAITEDIYQDLFRYIGSHPEISLSIFKHRAMNFGSGELLAWDSADHPCGSEGVTDGAVIVNKSNQPERCTKVLYLYSVTSRQLIAYQKLPGNIADVSTTTFAIQLVKMLNLQYPEVLQDNGYYSEGNIGEMLHEKIHFIIRVKATNALVSSLVKECYDNLYSGSMDNIIYIAPEYSGIAKCIEASFPYKRKYASSKKNLKAGDTEWISAKLKVFIYYSSYQKGKDDHEFRKRFAEVREDLLAGAYLSNESKQFAEQYFDTGKKPDGTIVVTPKRQEIKETFKYNGFLVLLADKESDRNNALAKYRMREKIEENIKGHKSHSGGDTSKTGDSDDFFDGELLVEFLGNSMRESFWSKIRAMKAELGVCNGEIEHDATANLKLEDSLKNWIRKKSFTNILHTFQTTELLRVSDKVHTYKLKKPITARNKLFLKKMGIAFE